MTKRVEKLEFKENGLLQEGASQSKE